MGIVVAPLGNVQNKQLFIAQQTGHYPAMSDWKIDATSDIEHLTKEALRAVSEGFDGQTRLAQLQAEYDALTTEKHYNDLLNGGISSDIEWLSPQSSAKLMRLLLFCQMMVETEQKPNLWSRVKWAFALGLRAFSLFRQDLSAVIASLEYAFYRSRSTEIEREQSAITGRLQAIDIQQNIKALTDLSLQLLKNKIARRYSSGSRRVFTIGDIKPKTETFLEEYPVVLSTTYSAKSCISKDMVFDYVIMDEASQVDIKTGALALSCALNAVIVGDDKQLPNVVSREEGLALTAIQSSYHVDDRYNAVTHSFLKSCTEIFEEAPTTLLREHYRCHPKIINFCNQRFYDGDLLAMTSDKGEDDVLKVIQTVKGNHARGHFNQREIDVIVQEVIPECVGKGSIGIITPYRRQAEAINKALGQDIASTVHKYQGRECDTIIMSTVDNAPTEFSDDANLLNVAISRAKNALCVVTSGNDIPRDTNLAQLLSYIRYNNFEVRDSKLHSVFDLLYQQYTTERLAYQSKHERVSDYLSENLVYNTIIDAINELGRSNLSVVDHYPLSRLIVDWTLLDERERTFAESPFSHVDFLVYNTLTKRPLLIIEVDGWHFHQESEVQQSRDILKDQILSKYQLTLRRLSTVEVVTKETMKAMLEDVL